MVNIPGTIEGRIMPASSLSGLPSGTASPGWGAVRSASAAEQNVLEMASWNPADKKVRRTAVSLSAHGSARTPSPKEGSVLAKPL